MRDQDALTERICDDKRPNLTEGSDGQFDRDREPVVTVFERKLHQKQPGQVMRGRIDLHQIDGAVLELP
jgi:hypothetical protein